LHLKFLVDENVDIRIVKRLKDNNFPVVSVFDTHRGISDIQVIELAKTESAIIVTEDKDFGDLVFSHKIDTIGVLFLRYHFKDLDKLISSLQSVVEKHKKDLYNRFVVITPEKVRFRQL
jgi:predicted nuclease of predicted toxin-antitoxin system